MGRFIINGGRPLYGTVRVSGSKNAALPIVFSCLITHGISKIYNLPRIGDVDTALEILKELGAVISRESDAVYIDTSDLRYKLPSEAEVSKLRASTYLIGACLVRFREVELQKFGGCNFSLRPIDLHISSAESFGATAESGRIYTKSGLRPADISLTKKSVGATVNALIMASGTDGISTIKGYAEEPHINTLIKFLRSAGAQIVRDGGTLVVKGGRLHGGTVTIPGDMIEAGTFLSAGLLTEGWVSVKGFDTRELSSFIAPLERSGVMSSVTCDSISQHSLPTSEINVVTDPYPAFPTDLQPVMAAVMARFNGGSIEERVWQGRFGYLSELMKFGVKYRLDGNRAEIFPSVISNATAEATDLRGGMSEILLALSAKGESVIENGGLVMRGYEDLCAKLSSLGAEIFYRD